MCSTGSMRAGSCTAAIAKCVDELCPGAKSECRLLALLARSPPRTKSTAAGRQADQPRTCVGRKKLTLSRRELVTTTIWRVAYADRCGDPRTARAAAHFGKKANTSAQSGQCSSASFRTIASLCSLSLAPKSSVNVPLRARERNSANSDVCSRSSVR